MKVRIVLLAVLVLALGLWRGFLFGGHLAGRSVASADHVIIGTNLPDFNPYCVTPESTFISSVHRLLQTSEGLVTMGWDGEVNPCLAIHWEISEDQRVYTFYLRQGVSFTDGVPFDAEAMKWSLDRSMVLYGNVQEIEEVRVIDRHVIQIVTRKPQADFLQKLAEVPAAFAFSPESTPANEPAYGRFAGTGPYAIESFDDQEVVYRFYEEYWGGRPEGIVDVVIEKYLPDPSHFLLALEAGDIDLALGWYLDNSYLEEILARTDVASSGVYDCSGCEPPKPAPAVASLAFSPTPRFFVWFFPLCIPKMVYLCFNTCKPPCHTREIRLAISKLLSKEVFIELYPRTLGLARSFLPNCVKHSKETFSEFADVESGMEMLKSLGFTEEHPLELLLLTPGAPPTDLVNKASELILAQLNRTQIMEAGGACAVGPLDRTCSAGYDAFLYTWNPWPHTAERYLGILDAFPVLQSFDGYESIEGLRAEAACIPEYNDAAYEEIQEILAIDVPVMPLLGDKSSLTVVKREDSKVDVGNFIIDLLHKYLTKGR